jgi:hypothetical protein
VAVTAAVAVVAAALERMAARVTTAAAGASTDELLANNAWKLAVAPAAEDAVAVPAAGFPVVGLPAAVRRGDVSNSASEGLAT